MLIDFVRRFSEEKVCLRYLAKIRWGDKVICPYCKKTKIYHFKDGLRYKCAVCKRVFNPKTKSIFHNTKLPLCKWFIAYYLISSHKKGISSVQLSKDIGVTQKTAWFMLQKIRSIFADERILSGIVEVDETYIGGREKNKHIDKRQKGTQGRSLKTKSCALGMLERGGRVKAIRISDVTLKIIRPVIYTSIKYGSSIMTDEFDNYKRLRGYRHKFCIHSSKQYVNGDAHTNGMENFWSLAKRSIFGIYHWVSSKYLQNYLDEFCFRYNTRKLSELDRIEYLLMKSVA